VKNLARKRLLLKSVAIAGSLIVASALLGMSGEEDQIQLQLGPEALYEPGTQPQTDLNLFKPILSATDCSYCHAEFNATTAPYDTWISSMMAQSARDPIWHAALSIANQDASHGGETCIRCHAPRGWLSGKSSDGLIDDFDAVDYEGINCHFCHRAVNPEYGENSAVGYPPADGSTNSGPLDPDQPILAALEAQGHATHFVGNTTLVIDPVDSRRGPYSDVPENFYNVHQTDGYGNFVWLVESPYHRQSSFCGECHDVSNPLYLYDPETGQHELTPLDQEHPTHDPKDMYAEQRTYSEWLVSDFASGGVYFEDGRFGGAHPTGIMESCTDCHMPKQVGAGCVFLEYDPDNYRQDIGQHSFAGSNTWVVGAIREQLGENAGLIGLSEERVASAKLRTLEMLGNASDMELTLEETGELNVRIINQSGHKLPTGYPEGRRMWLNVRYFDAADDELKTEERGAFEAGYLLNPGDSKVYEMRAGIDAEVAAATNLPVGPGFHLVLNNTTYFDNRIPPMGATRAELASVRAENVPNDLYEDNQYWDDTQYPVPSDARSAVVTLYYQTTSGEYIDFLAENSQDGTGTLAKQLWLDNEGMVPAIMDQQVITLDNQYIDADINQDGTVNGQDLTIMLAQWGQPGGSADLNGDDLVNGIDLAILLASWGSYGN
jgi:hypothetical protein